MVERYIPNKLNVGDIIRVIAPSRPLSVLGKERIAIANKRFNDIGLGVTFGENVDVGDNPSQTSVQAKVKDIHDAFLDDKVKAIFAAIGGYHSNRLLPNIDWDVLRTNPKIFCGYSDIDSLNNAIYAKIGLVTYSGPLYSTFSQKLHFNYTEDNFRRCIMSMDTFVLTPSGQWSDDEWYKGQEKRKLVANSGYITIQEGEATGIIVGTNLCTLNSLQGSSYFPSIDGSILFLEDDYLSSPDVFDRNLQSLINIDTFSGVKGIVFGRFQIKSGVTIDLLREMIKAKAQLKKIPIVANVDFGHTDPKITVPIGGLAIITASVHDQSIKIIEH